MEQIVTIPEYIQKVKVADKRRPTYYTERDRIPMKYRGEGFEFRDKKYKNGKQKLLFNTSKKEFVIKNAKVAGKPRYVQIRGNLLYAGMNEHLRMRMIMAIKDDFRRYIQSMIKIEQFPIQINAELHTKPEQCNWDIDNLWVYVKVFQDLLIEYQIIPDDSVRYITKPPSFEYFPVSELKDRKMIFRIISDTRNITSHVMFNINPLPITKIKGQYASPDPAIYLVTEDIKAGSSAIVRDGIHFRCSVGIGKTKIRYEELSTVLFNVKYLAVQRNVSVVIDNNFGREFPNYDEDKVRALIIKYLSNEGIKVVIHNL